MSKEPQLKKFKSLAKQVECDQDEKAFEEKLRRITRPGPESPEKKTRVKAKKA